MISDFGFRISNFQPTTPPKVCVRVLRAGGPRAAAVEAGHSLTRQPGRLPHNRSGTGFLVGHASRVPGGSPHPAFNIPRFVSGWEERQIRNPKFEIRNQKDGWVG